jgi:energy-converting hydrogenase Eha subunit B
MNARLVDRLLSPCALVLLLLLLGRALLTVAPYFDSFYYHLPFAARLVGLCPKSCFEMWPGLEGAYEGFPKLLHLLQGIVWRLTGRAEVVGVLSLGAIALFCVFLRRWFRVPLAWTFCGLLAVPLVQMHATSAYVDVPANLAGAAAILALIAFVRAPEAFGWSKLAVLVACLGIAANTKAQMIAVALPLAALFGALAVFFLASGHRVGPLQPRRAASWAALACVLACALVATAIKPIDNAIRYANPFYPLRLAFFGVVLDGPFDVTGLEPTSLSAVWRPVPPPLRWLASVLEVGAYDGREVPWTFDQGYCASALDLGECAIAPGSAFRMGGYFVPYVLALLAFLGWRLAAHPDRRLIGASFGATTLIAALVPRSHELRYYLFWMIVLVALCLVAAFDEARHRTPASASARGMLGTIVLVALASVLLMSEARYVSPFGPDMQGIIRLRGIAQEVTTIPDGAVVCVEEPKRQPFKFLYASLFHGRRSYSFRDAPMGPDCTMTLPPLSDE